MKIAVLGWGSLLWDKRPEFERQIGTWDLDGPKLNLEFSRISESRKGALTLVIDEDHGAPCQVAYAMSRRSNITDAVCDLRCREGTIQRRIGYFCADPYAKGEPEVSAAIEKWLTNKAFDAVVWTGLPRNFEQTNSAGFSVQTAVAYLANLPPEGKSLAAEYIWKAPDFIKTPLRTAMDVAPWFPTPR